MDIYEILKPFINEKTLPQNVLKQLYPFDTYWISNILKKHKLLELLNFYRTFKASNKLCKNCNEFYPVKHSKSREICPNPQCQSFYKEKNKIAFEKMSQTKLERYGDTKFNNRQKFKETLGEMPLEKKAKWNSNKSKALKKSKQEWDLITQKRQETHFKKTGFKSPFQVPENKSKALKKLKETQEKAHKTNLQKYGSISPFGNSVIQEKIKNTNLQKYGVEYVSQSVEIQNKIKNTNLQKYGVENVSQSVEIQNKIKNTNLQNWGTNSHTQSPLWKSKVQQSYKEKFGVTFAPKSHLKNLENYDNSNFWIENFGEFKNGILQFDFDKIYQFFGVSYTTVLHKLKSFNFEFEFRKKSTCGFNELKFLEAYETEFNVKVLRQFKISKFKVDGFIPTENSQNSKGLIIEYLGDYWHGNLRYFKSKEFNNSTGESFESLCLKTFKRFDEFLNLGYKVQYIWESDFLKHGISAMREYKNYDVIISNFLNENKIFYTRNGDFYYLSSVENCEVTENTASVILCLHRMEALPKYLTNEIHNFTISQNTRTIHLFTPYIENPKKFNVLKNLILHSLGKSQHRVYARKLDIRVFKALEVKSFFEENNINGYRNAEFAVCLMQNDEIIMSYSVGHAYFGKGKYDAEIARGACKLGYSVVGGASKLWNFIIKNFKYNSIVYYVDLNFYDGKSINFLSNCKKISEAPGFWNYWVNLDELKNREPHKHKVIKDLIKEGEVIQIKNAGAQVNVWTRPTE